MNYLYNTPIIPISQLGYLFFTIQKNEARIISCFVLLCGNTSSANVYASSRCGYPDKINVSIPSSLYSFKRSATISGLPTRAVPAPSRAKPIPAHRFGAISSAPRSFVPLCKLDCVFGQWSQMTQTYLETL